MLKILTTATTIIMLGLPQRAWRKRAVDTSAAYHGSGIIAGINRSSQ
jgi:hypothetical protein